MTLVAKTFGSYAITFFNAGENSHLWVNGFANGIIILFVLINLRGVGSVARWEKLIVATKILVLISFAIVGLIFSRPELLSSALYPEGKMVLYSLAITFFAFEGFRVITNAAEDMPDPARTLPRAMFLSIILVMLLYIAVALAVFGNLNVDQVIQAKDFALAEVAKPIFGAIGFTIVAIAALIILMTNFFPLSEIAAVGSIAILIVHLIVHLGHLRVRAETGASLVILLLAILAVLAAIGFAVTYSIKTSPHIIWFVATALVCAFAT